jgi:hypothetical protein
MRDGESSPRWFRQSLFVLLQSRYSRYGTKRIPDDAATNPVMIGHEFCGEILEVGTKWAHKYKPHDKFVIQPALNYKGSLDAPGYSYRFIGGNATHVIIPNEVMLMNCLLPFEGDSWFSGSLTEPLSWCWALSRMYHTERGSYEHSMASSPAGVCDPCRCRADGARRDRLYSALRASPLFVGGVGNR